MRNVKTLRGFKGLIIFLFVLLLGVVISQLFPVMKEVFATHDQSLLKTYIQSLGMTGVAALILLQSLQVMVAIIPSASIQVAAGVSYGIVLGGIICLIGFTLGNVTMYLLLRKVFNQIKPDVKIKRILKQFEQYLNHKNKEFIMFIIFLIPIFPNGIKPYFAIAANISFPTYLYCTMIGGLFPIFTGSLIGDLLFNGRYMEASILFMTIGFMISILYYFRKKIFSI